MLARSRLPDIGFFTSHDSQRLERSDKREISLTTAARFGRSEARMSDKVVEASHVAGHKM